MVTHKWSNQKIGASWVNLLRNARLSRSATLRGKVIHGTFYKQIENLGTGGVSQWLVEGKLSPADEAKLMVVQDGTIKDQEIKHYLYTFFSISYLYLVIGIEIGALEMVFTNKN